ncbi:hypothetical protein GCM10022223_06070 [Kineosporia mesophila]|uniref:Right handed beta helix domain-containing protein n=1 Tax=Kineosporia mesophila TaxID=566012 RepID=A0ABP6Z2K8_9ACTN|nr:right-handed parallel beta-helix repeat-containing protein [Kineosporia mesophila]MCD5350991.1 right-handed parallel beta-helix repeat-containing protein [Kineosporia mesophila]
MTKPTPITGATTKAADDSAIKSSGNRNGGALRSRARVLTFSLAAAVALSTVGVTTFSVARAETAAAAGATQAKVTKAAQAKSSPGKKRRKRGPSTPAPTTPAPAPSTPAPATPAPATPAPATPAPSIPAPAPTPPAPPATTPSTPPAVGSLPTAPSAGTPAGLHLTASGGLTITKAGTVIDGADISGNVVVAADGVVIRNSKITGTSGLGVYVRSGSLIMEDTTVKGFENSVGGSGYTATRVEVTGAFGDGFKIGDNVTIQNSWCHDLAPAPDAHADCGQVQSGVKNVLIHGNWFDMVEGGNAALFMAPDLGPSSAGPLTVTNNVFGGGNFSVYCLDGANGQYFIDGITIAGNKFLSNSQYGPMRVNVSATLTNNVNQDGTAAQLG